MYPEVMTAGCHSVRWVRYASVLFPKPLARWIARDGSITLTFRNWSRPQAKVGGRYRTGGGDLVVESIEPVELRSR